MSSKQTGKWMFVYPSLSKKKVTYFWRYWPINPFKGYHLISIHIQHPSLFRPGANISHWRGILAVPQMQEAPVCVIARCDIGRKAPELPASHALVDVFLGRCRFTNPINLQYRSLTSWIYIMNHGKSTNPWKIHGKSMENPWEIHGKSMENPWKIIHHLLVEFPATPLIEFSTFQVSMEQNRWEPQRLRWICLYKFGWWPEFDPCPIRYRSPRWIYCLCMFMLFHKQLPLFACVCYVNLFETENIS